MHSDSDLTKKTKKTCEKVSENLYILGNEPSLACFRIQEHCHKSVPQLIDKMNEMKRIQSRLIGNFYDLEYSISAIKSMYGTESHFQNIQELLKNSLFIKQQLDYEENVRNRVSAMTSGSGSGQTPISATNRRGFQRFSGSFDLPTSLISSSLKSVTSSASADLKDLRSVINQMTTPPSATKRNRTSSLSSAQPLKRHSEVPQTSESNDNSTQPTEQESNHNNN